MNKLKYLLIIKIPRWRNFNTIASSHSILFAKNKVNCIVINIRDGVFLSLKCLYWSFICYSNIYQSYSSVDMEEKCHKREWVTKYKCLECFAQKLRDHDNYSEEEKLIRKWENCDGNQVVVKQKSKNKCLKDFFAKKYPRNLLTITEWLQ